MTNEFGFPSITPAAQASNEEIGFVRLEGNILLKINGSTVNIPKDDERFFMVNKAIDEKQFHLIPAMVDDSKRFDHIGLRLENGVLYTKENNQALPSELSNRIIDFSNSNAPVDALLKFWDNLKENASFNSRKMLFKFLEHNGHPLTADGCFIAYRSVRSDFKDHHTGTMDNSVGKVVEINRTEVDDNPNNTCSNGLHVATWDYASGFGSGERVMVEVKVRPQDVVCVPTDYNGTKMRVSKFEVLSVCEAPRMNEAVYRQKELAMMTTGLEDSEEECDEFDYEDFDLDNDLNDEESDDNY